MSAEMVSSIVSRSVLQVGTLASGGSAHLSFLRAGRGQPVLLLHGFASDAAEDWVETGWFDAMSAGHDVVAPDLRGHGRSAKTHDPADYRLDAFAADVAAPCGHCWGRLRFSVIGYSMGAHVAMSVALASVDRVERLILGGMGDRIAKTVGLGPEFADVLEEPDDDRLDAFPPYAVRFRRHAASRPSNDLRVLAACLRGQSGLFDLGRLAVVTAPTLVIAGEQDRLAGVPYPVAALFAAGIGVTVPDANHASALAARKFRERALVHLERDFAMITASGKST